MDPSPLPEPAVAQLSAPALVPGASPERLYLLDGNLLKAYSLPSGTLLWSSAVGYFWNPRPVAAADGRVYVTTYDPGFPPDRPHYQLRGFNPDGTPAGDFEFNNRPAGPLVLPDGRLVIALSEPAAATRSLSAEPAGAKLVVLTPELELDWSSSVPGSLLRPPVADASRIYAADAAAVHVFEFDGTDVGNLPLVDPSQAGDLACTGNLCYVAAGNVLRQLDGIDQNWEVTLPAAALPGSLQADASGAYLLLVTGVLYAAASADGAERWSEQLPAASKLRLALGPDGLLYAAVGRGGAGDGDTLLAYTVAGEPAWELPLAGRSSGPLTPADFGVAMLLSPPRDDRRSSLLLIGPDGTPGLALAAGEFVPQALVNGQSTRNPPWPSLQY